jgi:gamma-glutamyltranspeptidase/glutathione hydrolase
MRQCLRPIIVIALLAFARTSFAAVPVAVVPVTAAHGMVVAGHPQAAAIGIEVLRHGGNAMDAAVAVSFALNVAEPYASGLGGKLMLLYYEAASGRTYAVDAMDAAGSVDVAAYLRRPAADHSYGYGAVCVPGLADGLWQAHQRWGREQWSQLLQPAIKLAQTGFEVLPKTRMFFAEKEKTLRRGDAEIARLYLPGGKLPAVGSQLANPDLAATLDRVARFGRDGFYRGPVAEAIVRAAQAGGGCLTLDDLADYTARIERPVGIEFDGAEILSAPPPTTGAPLFLTILKALEGSPPPAPVLRSATYLDEIGRVWRLVQPRIYGLIGDAPQARFNFEKLVAPDSIDALRKQAALATRIPAAAMWRAGPFYEDKEAATTHFIVVDAAGDIVCATQSLSLHFGAGVVAPGTGVVLNDSMSNFAFTEPGSINGLAPGRRPPSTIAPTIVFKNGRPAFAIGIPGSSRIPTALLQAIIDHLVLHRSLAAAIGDTRVHWYRSYRTGEEMIEAENSLPAGVAAGLRALGWKVNLREPAGRGQFFGGINAVEFNADGTLTGLADPRRTNMAAGY